MKEVRIVYGAHSYNAKRYSKYGNVSGKVYGLDEYEVYSDFTPRFNTSFEYLNLAERSKSANYANPCEEYTVQLDGASTPYPSVWGEEDMEMLCSTELSGGYDTDRYGITMNSAFDNEYRIPQVGLYDPYLTGKGLAIQIDCLDADGNSAKYTARGFTVEYDSVNAVYPVDVSIYTFDGDKCLQYGTFTEGDNLTQTCPTIFSTPFNKVILVFHALNVPHASLRIKRIIFGRDYEIKSNMLTSVTREEEFAPIFASLYETTVDMALSMRGKKYDFRKNDTVDVYAGDEHLQFAIVSKASKTRGVWRVNAYDTVGMLEYIPYKGALFTRDKQITWQKVAEDICKSARIIYEIESEEPNEEDYVEGFIPYSNCREALALLCAAFGLIVDTRKQKLTIKKKQATPAKSLPADRIFDDMSISETTFATSVEAYAYSYAEGWEEETIYTVSGTSTTSALTLVKFSEPVVASSIAIKRGNDNIVKDKGVVTSISETHVEFYAKGGDKITAKRYVGAQNVISLSNPSATADDVDNVVTYKGNTLISQNLLDKTANMCYDYYVKKAQPNMEFTYALSDESLRVGDSVCYSVDGKQYDDMLVTRLTQSFRAGREFVKIKVN